MRFLRLEWHQRAVYGHFLFLSVWLLFKRIVFRNFAEKEKAMDEFAPKPVKDCYHVYSDGTRVLVLCDTEEDFIYMMNQIAVAAFFCNVNLLSVEVMRTHFHIVVRGQQEKIAKFKIELKRLIVRRYNRDGKGELVKNSISIVADPIKDMEELRRKIIYVFRNSTEAGFKNMPEDYPWGPGRAYCHERRSQNRKVGSLDYREACRMFRTRVKLPENWEYDDKGMLVPESYLDKDYLDGEVFQSPRMFIAFLNVRKKDLAEMEATDARPFLEKKDEGRLLRELETASQKQYGRTIKQLSQADKIELATRFWNEGKTLSIKQLARLTRQNEDVLRAILHVPRRE